MAIDDLTLYDKNHIMSRIEKFLFAICSLDSSDLPIPLSRIEELYNCLVTGDTPPTFEPLSRAEKFLMACLGGYDINKLPEPLSRSEVLLKKIATGDNNLEDVDNLQSKYEFLLAYIIQNGGIGGIDGDISYMKYTLTEKETTLYNTKERPVNNAILKGNTLVNLIDYNNATINTNSKYIQLEGMLRRIVGETITVINNSDKTIRAQTTENEGGAFKRQIVIEANTKKRIVLEADERFTRIRGTQGDGWKVNESGLNELKITTMVIEGDYTNIDIPYFEGMGAVKMPVLTTTNRINVFIENKEFSRGYYNGGSGVKASHDYMDGYICDVEPNTTYSLYFKDGEPDTNKIQHVSFWNENTYISGWSTNPITFTTPANCNKLRFAYDRRATNINPLFIPSNIVLSIGTGVVYDESFKSNILTCNEEVELCKIGDMRDELNLVTGEYTKLIHEYTFTGDENWKLNSGANGGYTYFSCNMGGLLVNYDYKTPINIPISCNRLPVITYNDFDSKLTSVGINLTYFFRLNFSDCDSNNGATVEDLKAYLKANPTTVQYPISKSVKTVDLSTLDQDGNNTNLSSFNDITYVTLSSEGLIPEAELEVATKNEEVLNTLSLEMDDISTAQAFLEESSNIQSENVDATMIATTEIYEGLL